MKQATIPMVKLLKLIFTIGLTLFFTSVKSQLETANWYFGFQAGLNFNTTPPGILSNGVINSAEGSAVISDGAGNLLFYTDGMTIYNQAHQILANGSGLLGNISSSQSSIIIKKPGNNTFYYVFTTDQSNGPDGLCYSIVDMSLAAGMGSVTAKNVLLQTPSTEKLTATMHCNGTDVWVLSHDFNSNNFRAFLLTSSGLNTNAILSQIGAVHGPTQGAGVGCMKFSPSGKKIASCVFGTSYLELFDFNRSTGVVSNSLVLITSSSPYGIPYGCEFSPDGSKFYATSFSFGELLQWDLTAGTGPAIVASQILIPSSGAMQLQLALDGKIYAGKMAQTIGVINNPNAAGLGCNYINSGQSTGLNSLPKMGLPNFLCSYFRKKPLPFTTQTSCKSTSFTAPFYSTVTPLSSASDDPVTGVQWFFDDPVSGSTNTSVLSNPVHVFSGAGTYTVALVLYSNCYTDTLKKTITINVPQISLAGNLMVCPGGSATLTANGADTYSWGTFPISGASIIVTPSITTTYTAFGTSTVTGCQNSQTVTVIINPCTPMTEINYDLDVILYPNPSNDFINIKVVPPYQLRIYDQHGQIIIEKNIEVVSTQFDIKELKAGIYLFQVSKSKGSKIFKISKY